MTKTETKRIIEWLKDNCDTFLDLVRDYMEETCWTWWDSQSAPTIPRLRGAFFELLDSILECSETSCGGFTIKKDDRKISCFFGHKDCVPVYSLVKSLDEFEDGGSREVLEYIDLLCKECPVLDRDYLMEKYYNMKNM